MQLSNQDRMFRDLRYESMTWALPHEGQHLRLSRVLTSVPVQNRDARAIYRSQTQTQILTEAEEKKEKHWDLYTQFLSI